MYPESGLHSRMTSGADSDIWLVFQIQESRILKDPGIFGSKMAVLALTSSLVRTLNLFKVVLSAPSRSLTSAVHFGIMCNLVSYADDGCVWSGLGAFFICKYWNNFWAIASHKAAKYRVACLTQRLYEMDGQLCCGMKEDEAGYVQRVSRVRNSCPPVFDLLQMDQPFHPHHPHC